MEHAHLHLCREPARRLITGVATSSWYEFQKRGLAPTPIKLSAARVAWVYGELVAVNAARIAGKSDEEIRAIVAELVAARRNAMAPRAA